MQNVIQFPGPARADPEIDFITSTDVMKGLQRLTLAGVVPSQAHAIGMQALYFIASNPSKKTGFVEMTWDEIKQRHVSYNGSILAFPPQFYPDREQSDLSLCLLHLHSFGILNSLDKKFFNQSGNPKMHFVIPHRMRDTPDLRGGTPIYFRLDKVPRSHYETLIHTSLKNALGASSELSITAA